MTTCPRCQRDAVRHIGTVADANYFRCRECGLVWHLPTDGDDKVTIVSEPPWQSPHG
jgi:transposase-like protein